MVQVDIPIVFGVGAVMAHAARDQIKTGSREHYLRALTHNLILLNGFVIWAPIYLLVFYFGFETSHMWWHGDSVRSYPWLLPAFFLAMLGANLAGFHIGVRLIQQGRAQLNWVLFGAAMAFTTAWIGLQTSRTLTLGTYAEWQAGTARWMWEDTAFFWTVGGFVVVFTVAFVSFYRSLREAAWD